MTAGYELQKAVRALLAGLPEGAKVYDRVPVDRPNGAPLGYPYVALGEIQELDAGADCIVGSEVYLTLHVWSNEPGKRQAAAIAKAVKTALDGATITLPAPFQAVGEIHIDQIRMLSDPDPLITHGVVTLRASIDEL